MKQSVQNNHFEFVKEYLGYCNPDQRNGKNDFAIIFVYSIKKKGKNKKRVKFTIIYCLHFSMIWWI